MTSPSLSVEELKKRACEIIERNKKEIVDFEESYKNQNDIIVKNQIKDDKINNNQTLEEPNFKNKTISQIKNFSQKDYIEDKGQTSKSENFININSFDQLIQICNDKKEVKLKYELENNVKLVNFQISKIEITK